MLLSSTIAHGVRAMIYIARQPDGQLCKVKDIAAVAAVPPAFLEKILQRLRQRHLLQSFRSARGGYCLGRAAGQIRMLDILEALEGDVNEDVCFLGHGKCGLENPCSLHLCMQPVKEHFFTVMKNTTLAEVAGLPAIAKPPRKKKKGDTHVEIDRSTRARSHLEF